MRSIDELATDICTLAGHLNAANHRWLLLIAEFDRRQGWSDSATQSCAHWLNWKCGIAMGAAREKVRVAHSLEKLPKISAAMACGKLSYSKVREITRVAEPATEDYLLMIAEHGTAQHVEKLVRAYRRCQEAEELSREARQQQNRAVSFRYDDDGSLVLTCRLPAEVGARVMKALDVAVQELPKDVPAGTPVQPPSFSARRADALGLIAESFLAHGAIEAAGAERYQIVVHVAEEALRHRAAGCCEFEHGPSMAAEVGARVMKALDVAVQELPKDVPAGTSVQPPSFSARRADALGLVAESFLAHGAIEAAGAERYQIVVHVAEETLRHRAAGCCQFEHGPSMPAETARRLSCDASVVALVENDDGEPLNVGRKTRTISAPLRRALNARDKGCRFPGCANTRYLDAHHVEHWANGGETKPSNLVSLCRFHHHAVHEGGMRIQILDDGALRFVKQGGVAIDSVLPGFTQPLGDWTQLPVGTQENKWAGERMDYGLGLEVLFQQSRRKKDVPAGTLEG